MPQPDLLLHVPTFRRLDEYFGVWACEPERFLATWRVAKLTDMSAHMAAAPAIRQSSMQLEPARGGKSVAVIHAAGMLMKQQSSMGGTSTVQLRRDIRQAAADPNVSGILMAWDSPGGTAAGTMDLANDIAAASRKKPVWSQISDLGASAAYWGASQSDMIFASTPTTAVGSIGTYNVVYDESGLAEQQGVKTLVFSTGPLKGMGVPGSAITDEQKAAYQKLVDDLQTHFDSAVRKGRGMNQTQLNAVRTGGVWLADEAKSLRLIDGIQSMDKTLADLASAK